jgi:hypothetical protein
MVLFCRKVSYAIDWTDFHKKIKKKAVALLQVVPPL